MLSRVLMASVRTKADVLIRLQLLTFVGGGSNWSGASSCVAGYTCSYQNPFYSQCVPGTGEQDYKNAEK